MTECIPSPFYLITINVVGYMSVPPLAPFNVLMMLLAEKLIPGKVSPFRRTGSNLYDQW